MCGDRGGLEQGLSGQGTSGAPGPPAGVWPRLGLLWKRTLRAPPPIAGLGLAPGLLTHCLPPPPGSLCLWTPHPLLCTPGSRLGLWAGWLDSFWQCVGSGEAGRVGTVSRGSWWVRTLRTLFPEGWEEPCWLWAAGLFRVQTGSGPSGPEGELCARLAPAHPGLGTWASPSSRTRGRTSRLSGRWSPWEHTPGPKQALPPMWVWPGCLGLLLGRHLPAAPVEPTPMAWVPGGSDCWGHVEGSTQRVLCPQSTGSECPGLWCPPPAPGLRPEGCC